MKQVITLRVNGTEYTLAAEPNATLADVLREELRFTGVKKGCDDGECGACSVLLDKCKVIPSCTTLACEVQGHDITTVEGLKQGDQLHHRAAGVCRLLRSAVRLLHSRHDNGHLRPPHGERRSH